MKSFRNIKYVERYEDVFFDLETPLNIPANNARENKDGYRFVVDNNGEVTPFDWYNARISVPFKVTKTNGDDIGADATADNMGIVNGSHFHKKFDVKLNGRNVYDCNDANQSANIKKSVKIQSNICTNHCIK